MTTYLIVNTTRVKYVSFNFKFTLTGKRFAGMELKLVLSEILSKYEVLPCEKTEVPLEYSITPGFISSKNGIWLTFKSIVN